MKKRHQQKLVMIGIILFFLWNVPFVTLIDSDFHLFGFPAFYIFIFLSWFIGIAVAYYILKKFYE